MMQQTYPVPMVQQQKTLQQPYQHLPQGNTVNLFEGERSPLYWANLYAKDFIIVNQGGTSSGKTEAIVRVLITIAICCPQFIVTVVSNTIRKLQEDSLRIALRVIQQPEIAQFVVQYHVTNRVITFSNGTTMSFKSYDDLEAAKGEKHDILYINELTRIPRLMFYELYLRTKKRIFVDYNPTSEFYVHTWILKDKKEFPSVMCIRSWHIHNPYLNDADRAKIERIGDKDMHKVYARGLTGRLKGMIYASWVEVDCEFEYRDGVTWGTDWGFSEKEKADPTAGVRMIINPPEYPELDILFDEVVYARGIPPSHVAQVYKEVGYKDGQANYCDHALEANYEIQMHGITGTANAIKGPGSILAGLLYLRRKRVGYTKRSINLKIELNKYKFMEIDGIETNTPVDEHNHLLDACRYAGYTRALATGDVK